MSQVAIRLTPEEFRESLDAVMGRVQALLDTVRSLGDAALVSDHVFHVSLGTVRAEIEKMDRAPVETLREMAIVALIGGEDVITVEFDREYLDEEEYEAEDRSEG